MIFAVRVIGRSKKLRFMSKRPMVKRRRMMQIMAKRSATNPRKRLPELTRPCSALSLEPVARQ